MNEHDDERIEDLDVTDGEAADVKGGADALRPNPTGDGTTGWGLKITPVGKPTTDVKVYQPGGPHF